MSNNTCIVVGVWHDEICQLILLFSLFLLLFMGPTALFDTIYGFHCIISTKRAFGLGWKWLKVKLCFRSFFFFFWFQQHYLIKSNVNSARMHCLWVLQILLFSHFFIKNGSHSTIYTFKNYFATVFLVSVKISSIQTDPNFYLYL